MKTIEFDYVDKEQTNTIIRAARANGMEAMILGNELFIEGQPILTRKRLRLGWESLDIKSVTRTKERNNGTGKHDNTIRRKRQPQKKLIDRMYKRGFDEYTIHPSRIYPDKMIVQIPFDGNVNSSRAESQVQAMFGNIPRHY